jgi:hypothetical protein
MSRLIDDLLAYSRLERRALHAGLVNLDTLVESLVEECSAELKERAISVRLDLRPVRVTADADGLSMALRNLIDNAIKFTRDTPAPWLEIKLCETADRALLSVRDNGVGFDMKFHDRIFDIFQRLHPSDAYPGTGIGLAIVRKAMERMGGRAWGEPEPGEGATFCLEIPK